ncbi:malonic semialdehyde reductase [Deefgea rivuli]|uniref:malonic semialdehyde reductase n=1 Tax=Deefgea rivuli TaxID=400948 RepID=UPI00056533C5|nr:malonic semialdehyde reductase [Deefgea rivuli]
MRMPLPDAALAQLFSSARTHHHWLPQAVPDELLLNLYEQLKYGPTSANACPARFVFVKSAQAKARLLPCLSASNIEQTMAAPVTVIVAHDLAFFDALPELYPRADARSWFANASAEKIERTALQSATLQAAYLIIAARGLGLDCGPMGGFNPTLVDAEFFKGSTWKSNLLINLGYGDAQQLLPRDPRFPFADVCRIE